MSADVDGLRAELARTREVLSRRSAALDRVVGEKRTLEARLENVEALADSLVWKRPDSVPCADPVTCCGGPLNCAAMRPSTPVVGAEEIRAALDATVPSWRALCPHGGCADPDSCRDAIRADTTRVSWIKASDEETRCPSFYPYDEGLQCGREVHDDDQCRFGGIAWKKGEPPMLTDRERAYVAERQVARVETLADEWARVGIHDRAARRASTKLRAALWGDL